MSDQTEFTPLSVDQVLQALNGFTVTVAPADDLLSVTGGDRLPDEVKATFRHWRESYPEGREALMEQVWQALKPAGAVPEDAFRCPACPQRGKPAQTLFTPGDAICTAHRCPPGQKLTATLKV